jgi:hypothetical protein
MTEAIRLWVGLNGFVLAMLALELGTLIAMRMSERRFSWQVRRSSTGCQRA